MSKEALRVSNRCPIRTTLELLGGKWKLLILFQLSGEALRLSALKKAIPDISEKMLIQELKNLTDSGLVLRQNYGEVPPRVEYRLSEKGQKALPLIAQMRDFALAYEQAE
ncbi:winged helix-turn-helix transcriptional regulator [Eisenibacter elegans]|jgi:DNA-binding HxlR family transcriptional regulator|uniref:winged helix-turn-helix transcriptional regulator n=1 Tax=Eisenibacter elegans TaxID=997 RepID=UPI0003FA52E0|nr:helix-turn-helix domain-containing protein [Eisenibacter elegans]